LDSVSVPLARASQRLGSLAAANQTLSNEMLIDGTSTCPNAGLNVSLYTVML
jgi:hypothetical protein